MSILISKTISEKKLRKICSDSIQPKSFMVGSNYDAKDNF